MDGAGIPGAQITLTNISSLEHYSLVSAENGEFAFSKLPSGTYLIAAEVKGFEPYTSAQFTTSAGQTYDMPSIQLSITPQKQVIVVRPTEVIAEMQVKAEEKQRLIGVLPNFYTSYVWDVAPLNTKQKFSLQRTASSIPALCSQLARLPASSRRTIVLPDPDRVSRATENALRLHLPLTSSSTLSARQSTRRSSIKTRAIFTRGPAP